MQAFQQMLLAMGQASDLVIQSIQHGSVSLGSGVSSNTATISSVTTANSVIVFNGFTSTDSTNDPNEVYPGPTLTDPTTVTVARASGGASTAIYYFTVIEFKSGIIKSNQAGTIAILSATSNTATISSITTSNSAVFFQGSTYSSGTAAPESANARLNITSSTVITGTRVGSPAQTTTLYYTALEFNAGILNSSTQEISASITSTNTSNTASLSAITMGQSMLVWGGFTTTMTTTSHGNAFPCVVLTSTTAATITRADASSATVTATVTALEFKAAAIKSINRAKTTISGATAQGTTISAVTISKTAMNFLGTTCSTTTSNQSYIWGAAYINSTTDIESIRAGSSFAADVSWEAIEFN